MTTYRLNCWKKDPHDEQDFDFAVVENVLKMKVASPLVQHLIPEHTPVSDQGNLGSCVGNSTTDALEILLGNQEGRVIQLSRLMTYWIARMLDKTTQQDEGTHIRSAFTQIAKLGVCPEYLWPYDESKVFISPSLKAYEVANSNKITSFYRITNVGSKRLDDIETAVRANHPVVFGTTVGSDFMNWEAGQPALTGETHPEGGHAIICSGIRYNTSNHHREFYIRNSWGTAWGDNGHIWLDQEYMMWPETNDLWVATMMPTILT